MTYQERGLEVQRFSKPRLRLNNRPLKFDLALVVRSPRRNLKVSKIFTKVLILYILDSFKIQNRFCMNTKGNTTGRLTIDSTTQNRESR